MCVIPSVCTCLLGGENNDPLAFPPPLKCLSSLTLELSTLGERISRGNIDAFHFEAKTKKAVHLSQSWFYQVQKSSNYFSCDRREIRKVGFGNPCYCAMEVASRYIHTSLRWNSLLTLMKAAAINAFQYKRIEAEVLYWRCLDMRATFNYLLLYQFPPKPCVWSYQWCHYTDAHRRPRLIIYTGCKWLLIVLTALFRGFILVMCFRRLLTSVSKTHIFRLPNCEHIWTGWWWWWGGWCSDSAVM